MKKFLFFAFLSLALVACDKKENDILQNGIEGGNKLFYLSLGDTKEVVLPPVGGVFHFAVTSEFDLRCDTNASWVKVSKDGGDGGTLEFQIDVNSCTEWTTAPSKNGTPSRRNCVVTLIAGNGSNSYSTIVIAQDKPYVSITEDNEDLVSYSRTFDWWNASGKSDNTPFKFTINSNVDWELTGVPTWLSCSMTSHTPQFSYENGTYDDTDKLITVIPVSYNVDEASRRKNISLVFGVEALNNKSSKSYTFDIGQDGLPFSVVNEDENAALTAKFYPCNAAQDAASFKINTPDRRWKVVTSATDNWFQCEPMSGDAGQDISLTVSFKDVNPNPTTRTAKVKVMCVVDESTADDNLPYKEITVSQNGYELGVSKSSFDNDNTTDILFDNNDLSEKDFFVISSGAWTITDVASGLKVFDINGNEVLSGVGLEYGEEPLKFRCVFRERNYSTSDSNLQFTLVSTEPGVEGVRFSTVTARQKAYVLNGTLPSEISVKKGSESTNFYTMNITSSGDWRVESSESWISFSETTGSGNGSVKFWANEVNPNTSRRTATISLISKTHEDAHKEELKREYTVAQLPFEFEVDKSTLTFDAVGSSSRSVSVTCSAQWAVGSKPSWVQVSKESGDGNAQLEISVDDNLTTIARSGKLYLTNDFNSEQKVIEIKQDKFLLEVTSTPQAGSIIPSASNTENFSDMKITLNVTCSSDYTVVCASGTVSADQKSVIVDYNPFSIQRPIAISINSKIGNYSTKVEFTQDPLTFVGSAVNITVDTPAQGVVYNKFKFACSGAWVVVPKDGCDWLTLFDTTTGKEVTKGTALAGSIELWPKITNDNTSADDRVGVVQLCLLQSKSGDTYTLCKEVTVTQKGISMSLNPAPSTEGSELYYQVGKSRVIKSVDVNCPLGWTVSLAEPNNGWLSVSKDFSGESFSFEAAANNTGAPRSAVIYVDSEYYSANKDSRLRKAITIKQTAN